MSISTQPLVSVVTPVYNGAAYLPECIESVLRQTYDNWEYLIINNCSTDETPQIAQHYAQKDARIKVITNQKLLDALQNHNFALRQISSGSHYCKMLHADDWLFPDCLSSMVALAEAYPSVGIVGAYRLEEDYVDLDGLPYHTVVVPGDEICRARLLGGPYLFGSPTSTLIRSDLVRGRDPFYDESLLHADTHIYFDLLQNCDFGFVHQVLTFTRRHNESRTSTANRLNTHRLENGVGLLLRYGLVFLTPEEYRRRLDKVLKSYYAFLAEKLLQFKGVDFWRYHIAGLRKFGLVFSPGRICVAFLYQLLDIRQTVLMLLSSLGSRQNPNAAPPNASRHS
jgi:glycosyltransferase involved in cell wall biosynthesis